MIDNDEDLFNENRNTEAPRWKTLDAKERQELMDFVFRDADWYDGTPRYKGGTYNPDFGALANSCGAETNDIKKYYMAWLKMKGFDPKDARSGDLSRIGTSPISEQIPTSGIGSQATQPATSLLFGQANTIGTPELMTPPEGTSGEGSAMWAMMNFLTQQQGMAMQQQQFQMQMQMEQRRFDESKAGDMRREQMSRDQQFMSQQTTLLKETMNRANEGDGFFDGEMKKHMKERFVEQLMGGGEDSWKDTVKDVLGSDTLKSAVSGLGTALTNKPSPIPAGYDVPNYNPYAQEIHQPIQQIPQQGYQPVPQQMPQQMPQQVEYQEPSAGVFFGDEEPDLETQEEPQPPQIQEVSKDEYKQILFDSFKDMLGTAMQDPQVAAAVQTQIDVAVDITLLEIPEALPQFKLQRMSEKMLLVRNLRDICFGLRDLRARVPVGSQPSGIIMSAVVSELRKRPEFYKIFAENAHESIVSQLDPFKDTGAIKFDYEYLLKPEIAEIARHMLNAVAHDAQTNGMPSIETLA